MASQNTLLVLLPYNNEPPTSNYATLDTRNNHLVLDFDGSINESAVFTAILPKQYGGNGINVYVHYSMTSDLSGEVKWDVSIERIGDEILDIDFDGFATAQSVSDTVPGTGGLVGVATIPFSDGAQMDALVAGESFRIKITRDAVTDSAIADAELLAIEIREQ